MTVVQPIVWEPKDIASMTGVDLDAITTLPNGGYVVTFRQNQKIGFQIYDGNGDKVGGTHFVSATQGAQQSPDIVTLKDGSFTITWTEPTDTTQGGRVQHFETFDINGDPEAITTLGAKTYDGAHLTANGVQNGWAAAYIEDVVTTNSSGQTTHTPTVKLVDSTQAEVTISGVNGVGDPDVAWLGQSKYVVSYLTLGVNSGFAFSVVSGNSVIATKSIANVVAADVVALMDSDGTPTGDFVVVTDTGTNTASKIQAQKYHANADGTIGTVGSAVDISTGTKPSAEDKVTVTALKDGGYAVAYVASTPTVDLADIWVKVVDKDGTAGPAIKIHNDTGSQLAPAISEMADGRLSVSWHNPSLSTSGGSTIETTIVDARADKINLTGTTGDDIFAPTRYQGDTLTGNGGHDTLTFKGAQAAVSVDLAAGTGFAGDANGDHYAGFDKVIGSNFADTLTGGTGASTLQGGAGDDIYFVNNAAHAVVEGANAGTDTVYTSVTYTLSAYVENMFATGSAAINLTGNDSNNSLTGNDAANVLTGGNGNDVLNGGGGNDNLDGGAGDDVLNGGSGADVMNGGAGNDVYYIDDANDRITDDAGFDTVYLAVNYDLSKLGSIENFTGIGAAGITLTGNAFNNTLTGNDGANILYGGAGNDTLNGGAGNDRLHGGLGADLLTGGAGKDIFVFDTNPKTRGNADKITDFYYKDDSIYLENKYFKGIGSKGSITKPAAMASKYFFAGARAHDADDRIIFDKKKGVLYYDDDGIGSHKAVVIATTTQKNIKMDYHDFFVI